jgi:MazG family protein
MSDKKTFQDLVEMMARLRGNDGCPWDREQTIASLGPMLIEEAWEVVEAADRQQWTDLRDELGDLLFQIIFYARIASEEHRFDIEDAITRVYEKMYRRHPHVFGDAAVSSTAEVLANWETIKAAERGADAASSDEKQSLSA